MALPEIIKDIDARIIRPTSTDNAIVRFDGTTGQVQNSLASIEDLGALTAPRIGINGTNALYKLYVDGTSYFTDHLQTTSYFKSTVKTGIAPIQVTSTTLNTNLNADLLDGYHESSFLRYIDSVHGIGHLSHSDSLWSQIGIRQYNNALPDAMIDRTANTHGAVISLPGDNSRLDLWYNQETSTNGNGLRYRTGWNDDKKDWATILDSVNYTSYAVSKTGDGASGTWEISISGNAASATNVNIANDTSSKIYVLGATTIGNTRIYRESSVYMQNNVLFGAAWNDYAEYRESNIAQPGRCIIENGDDTLRLSTERLQRGAEIISDTFGFAIGETDICKTPIAVSGRVLAYGYEDREQFKSHIGYPVCSGPDGTVSIMTDEEEQLYPSRIIGYISAVPDYEIWGTGNVKVDGRIWIRIK